VIFLTTGTQLPFDRLLLLVKSWAYKNKHKKFEVQSLTLIKSMDNFNVIRSLKPKEYISAVESCEAIIGHAGTGTIITALEYNKTALLMARRHSLKEHRNEHQLSTANAFSNYKGIYFFDNKEELFELLSQVNKLEKSELPIKNERQLLIDFLQKNI